QAAALVRAVRAAERGHVDRVGAAVRRVRPGVHGARDPLVALDRAGDLRRQRVGLGVDQVDAGRAQAGYDQIAALDVRARRGGAQGGAAGVPAEVVELVAGGPHLERRDDRAAAARAGL